MRRVYLVLDGHGKSWRKIKVREPKDYPTATHWAEWMQGSMCVDDEAVGEVTVWDQAILWPVKRLQ